MVDGLRDDAVIGLDEALEFQLVDVTNPLVATRQIGEQRIEINLVDTMRRLRRRPPTVRPVLVGVTIAPARDWDTREFNPGGRSAKRDVVGVIGGQPGVAHDADDAESAKYFHRAGRD